MTRLGISWITDRWTFVPFCTSIRVNFWRKSEIFHPCRYATCRCHFMMSMMERNERSTGVCSTLLNKWCRCMLSLMYTIGCRDGDYIFHRVCFLIEYEILHDYILLNRRDFSTIWYSNSETKSMLCIHYDVEFTMSLQGLHFWWNTSCEAYEDELESLLTVLDVNVCCIM
jgi:hypothetical protein